MTITERETLKNIKMYHPVYGDFTPSEFVEELNSFREKKKQEEILLGEMRVKYNYAKTADGYWHDHTEITELRERLGLRTFEEIGFGISMSKKKREREALKDEMKAELKAELKAEMDAEMTSMKAEILSLKAVITTLTEHSVIELDAILESAMIEIDETVGSILLKDIQ
jgi:hypothetical protein